MSQMGVSRYMRGWSKMHFLGLMGQERESVRSKG